MCVLLYFGTEYQNARSFEIILQIHLLICYLLDVIIYLFIVLTLFVRTRLCLSLRVCVSFLINLR